MDAAATGRLAAAPRCVIGMLAAFLGLLAVPCSAQDTPVVGIDLAPNGPPDILQASASSALARPRLSLTLGAPIGAQGFAPGAPLLDLGVQWRQPMTNDRHVDLTAWRRMTPEFDAVTLIRQREPVYGARVEMNLQGRKRGLVMDKRFLGLQLDSGTRITLRRKDGNPTLYYRSQF